MLVVFVRFHVTTLIHKCQSSSNGTLVNSAGPDQAPQNAASGQDLHCFHIIYRCSRKWKYKDEGLCRIRAGFGPHWNFNHVIFL